MKKPILWLVIPCYNEEEVLPITCPIFLNKLNQLIADDLIGANSRILFVNDGSKDKTWEILKDMAKINKKFVAISQSKNRGHQASLLAGLIEAKDNCDITISIDCDGQDSLDAMDEMIREYISGSDIVYGVRNDRKTDSFFKRNSAQLFYKLMSFLGAETVYNHADYRLISSKVLKELAKYEEANLFLRGLIPLVGFKSSSVYYKRTERLAGESHYPLGKMLALAFDGITSLSIKPIRIVTMMGCLVSFTGFLGIIWAIVLAFQGSTVAGWASTICIICFLGGIQLLSLGIIGEYVGKTYMETKRRPRYIISDSINLEKKDD